MNKGTFIVEVFDTTTQLSKGFITSSYGTIGDLTRAKPYYFNTSSDISQTLENCGKTLRRVLNPIHHGPLAVVDEAIRLKFFLHDRPEELQLISHIQQDPKLKVNENSDVWRS